MRFRLSVMASKHRNSIPANSASLCVRRNVVQSPCRSGRDVVSGVLDVVTADSSSPGRIAVARMWSTVNAGRGVVATLGLLLAMVLAMSAESAGVASREEPADLLQATLPDPGDVVSAYATLRGWVDGFDLPALTDPAAKVPLRGATGVCVILRRSGRVLGSGVDSTAGDLMLRRAAGRALGEVLGDPAVANLPPSMATRVGGALTLELEVAGRPIPLLGRSPEEIADQLEPGLDGVAIRRGQRWAMRFAAQMRAANTAGRVQHLLAPLAGELGLAPMTLPQLTALENVSIYRLRTTHLAQSRPDASPFETVRGDTIVSEADVTRQAIATLADGIATHLITSLSPMHEPLGIMGTYRPAADRYDPLIAPPLEQALTAFALARYSNAPGIDEAIAAEAGQVSRLILRQLGTVAPGEDDPLATAPSCAAIVYAGLVRKQTYEDPVCRPLIAAAIQRVQSAYSPQTGFTQADQETGKSYTIAPHGQALVAGALSRLLREGLTRVEAPIVRGAIDAAWDSVPKHQQVTLLPWLGWAESDFAAATGRPPANTHRLLEIRRVLDASRIGSPSRPGPPDLAGGFALATSGRSVATAQSVRAAAFLATILRDPVLTPADTAQTSLGRHLQTVRFVMQLAVRDSSAWALRDPSRALGGLQAALWDRDQPLPVQALGLICAVETLASLDALDPAQRNP